MKFYSTRDLRNNSNEMWSDLLKEDVVLTYNGRPAGLVTSIPEGLFEETVTAVRRAKSWSAIQIMQKDAVKRGLNKMTDEEIEAEIAAARAEGIRG